MDPHSLSSTKNIVSVFTTEQWILIWTGIFTAIAAISAYLSVTKGAVWAARALDKLDPMKQRIKDIQDNPRRSARSGSICVFTLTTGQVVFVTAIDKVEYQAVQVVGRIPDGGAQSKVTLANLNVLNIRYSAIAKIAT